MKHKPTFYERYIKRLLDILLSGLALIVLSPVLLVVAILVKIKLGSPVIFCQERPGKDEKIFKLYKFRTMRNAIDPETGEPLPDEHRMCPFGRTIRAMSLDELPELWNILRGDMSIVGPRPLLVKYLPFYTDEEKKRHNVRPGLTGFSQVNGRNTLRWEKRFALDIEYSNHITFAKDVEILAQTFLLVIKKSDIIEPGVLEDFDEYRKKQLSGIYSNTDDTIFNTK